LPPRDFPEPPGWSTCPPSPVYITSTHLPLDICSLSKVFLGGREQVSIACVPPGRGQVFSGPSSTG
jgi:hypothetical protein